MCRVFTEFNQDKFLFEYSDSNYIIDKSDNIPEDPINHWEFIPLEYHPQEHENSSDHSQEQDNTLEHSQDRDSMETNTSPCDPPPDVRPKTIPRTPKRMASTPKQKPIVPFKSIDFSVLFPEDPQNDSQMDSGYNTYLDSSQSFNNLTPMDKKSKTDCG